MLSLCKHLSFIVQKHTVLPFSTNDYFFSMWDFLLPIVLTHSFIIYFLSNLSYRRYFQNVMFFITLSSYSFFNIEIIWYELQKIYLIGVSTIEGNASLLPTSI